MSDLYQNNEIAAGDDEVSSVNDGRGAIRAVCMAIAAVVLIGVAIGAIRLLFDMHDDHDVSQQPTTSYEVVPEQIDTDIEPDLVPYRVESLPVDGPAAPPVMDAHVTAALVELRQFVGNESTAARKMNAFWLKSCDLTMVGPSQTQILLLDEIGGLYAELLAELRIKSNQVVTLPGSFAVARAQLCDE